MKLRIRTSRAIFLCTMLALFGAVLIFGMTIFIFLDWPWDWRQPAIIVIWFVSSIVFFVLQLKQNFFVLEKNFICHHKYKKELFYYFKDIVYIDKDYSEKHKTILFVTKQGDIRYMPFDKKGLLYQAMLDRAKNLISYEELIVKYPNAKKIKAPK